MPVTFKRLHFAGAQPREWSSLSVGEVIAELSKYPGDTPVLFTWEGVLREAELSRFKLESEKSDFSVPVLVIDAE